MLPPRTRTISAVVVTCALVSAVGAQTPSPSQPTFRSGVDLVTVDVTVLGRNGDPIDTLTADDFTLFVDGAPRPIVSMRQVRRSTTPVAATPDAPPQVALPAPDDEAQRRVFVLVVDREHLSAGEGQQMLEAAARFVDNLPVDDRVALWTLPQSTEPLRFNEDREALRKRLLLSVGTFRPPLGPWMVGRDEAILADENRPGVMNGIIARECYKQPQTCPSQVEVQVREVARDARQRTDATLSGIADLIAAIAPIEGPKQLVLVTGGPVRTFDNLGTISDVATRASLARVTVHALQVAEPSYQARTDQMRAAPAEVDQTASAAYLLATTTGGLAITPSSGNVAFTQLSRELSVAYALAFETQPGDRDGRVHQIQVKVADRGWGSSIRARRSFRVDPMAATTPAATDVPAPAPPEPVGTDPGDMADRLADYAEAFERELAVVVAEERYVQVIHPWRGNPSGPDNEPALIWRDPSGPPPKKAGGPIISRRQLLSDVLAVQLEKEQWLTYRDVAEVDGDAVRQRTDRVRELFMTPASARADQFRRIASESARYNLGDLRRELNLPTVTLSLLRRANHARFEFKRVKDESIDERACRVLSFREKTRPTLLSTPNSGDIFISGRVWLDQADGRVRRTELRFDRGSQKRSYIRVDFQAHEGLNVLVPALMWEWYEGADQLGRLISDATVIEGLALYSNVRRFRVSTGEQIK